MRARVTLTAKAGADFANASADVRRRLLEAIDDLSEDAEPDEWVPRPPIFLGRKTLRGLDVIYYVADLSRDPWPVQVVGFVDARS